MRVEVHVHGTILLRSGISNEQMESALRPLLDYIDEDSLADVRSIHPDEPGITFDRRRRVIEICWTGDVGRSFRQLLADALDALNAYCEEAAPVDITYYHEDGRDEFDVIFVGPTAESIDRARRQRMTEDLQHVLSRDFDDAEISQILNLVNQMFDRRWESGRRSSGAASTETSEMVARRKHLH
ncbi:MAG: hypothetical protein JSW48_09555 [Betaproteobacteria bacterium]|jgi:hypothetical protein|nr:MAG: hypothetical protein JSW48_09555 [Betaproteobacteria bacterium]